MRWLWLVVLLWISPVVSAQDICPVLTETTIEALNAQCRGIASGEACALDQPTVPFTTAGIAAPALIRVADGLTVALIGEALLQPIETEQITVVVTNTSGDGVNLRAGPGRDFLVVSVLASNNSAVADGQDANSEWLRLVDGGWIFAELVVVDGSVDALPVLDETSPFASDAPALLLTSANECDIAGVLFSTRGDSSMMINGVMLSWNASTVFVRTLDDDTLEIIVQDGDVMMTVDDRSEVLSAGESVQVTTDTIERGEIVVDSLELPLALVTVAAGSPEDIVYRYLEARTLADATEMQSLSCSAWDQQAITQSQSFRAMNAELQGVACSVSTSTDESAVVGCDGMIRTTYNGETRNWALSDYQLVQEQGQWLVCGEAN